MKHPESCREPLDKLLTCKAEESMRYTDQKYYEMDNRASCLLAFQLRKIQASHVVSNIYHSCGTRSSRSKRDHQEEHSSHCSDCRSILKKRHCLSNNDVIVFFLQRSAICRDLNHPVIPNSSIDVPGSTSAAWRMS